MDYVALSKYFTYKKAWYWPAAVVTAGALDAPFTASGGVVVLFVP